MKWHVVLLFSAALMAASFAQDAAPTGGRPSASGKRVLTPTLSVSRFTALEDKLMGAVQKKDKATLTALAADDFELRRAATPDQPIPLDEWIANTLPHYELREFHLSKMAVHLYGDETALVSATLSLGATDAGKDISGNYFVVDVWRQQAGEWKLSVRYISPVKNAVGAMDDRKPTGKE